jgi:hypothetical protein
MEAITQAARRGAIGLLAVVSSLSCGHAREASAAQGGDSMETTLEVRHVSVSIDRSPEEVYRFAANPENMSRWASGLAGSMRNVGGEWVGDGGPIGRVKVRFTEPNRFGVLDHDVTLESGLTVHNPVRVLPNGAGSEVVFSLFRRPGVSAEEFARDGSTVEKDLRTLKSLVEKGEGARGATAAR